MRERVVVRSVVVAASGMLGVLHVLRTDCDPRHRFVSEYVVGAWGGLMTSVFFVLAAGVLVLARGLRRSAAQKEAGILTLWVLLVLAACGSALMAFFPAYLNVTPVHLTMAGRLHAGIAAVTFTLALAAQGVFLRLTGQDVFQLTRGEKAAAFLLTILAVSAFFAQTLLLLRHRAEWIGAFPNYPDGAPAVAWVGVTERVLIAAFLGWLWEAAGFLSAGIPLSGRWRGRASSRESA